jgi:SAM-dependent methyltransferase
MCQDCGLVSIHPHPSANDLAESYHSYLPERPEEIRQWETMMRPIVVTSAKLIEMEVANKPGSLLDIGSGYGFFLEEMKRRGWRVDGVELSETGRKYTKRRMDVSVHPYPIESLCLPKNHYDVVTLFYVIEHLPDPVSTLREASRILKPDGLLLLRWPHSTPIVKMLGSFAGRLDLFHTPYHLYDFSPKTVAMLLVASSFKHVRTVIGGHTLPEIRLNRYASIITGVFAQMLWQLSNGRILVPGVSKTTMARNAGHWPAPKHGT